MGKLKIGEKAPDFKLIDKDNNMHELHNIRRKFIVLYFYSKDDTPGCTIEAREFSKHLEDFRALGASILGISGLDEMSKKRFCEKYKLKVVLLADKDFSNSKKYGVYGEKSFMGKKYEGIKRTTFVLDEDKKIIKIYENVKPRGHAEEVLEFLESHS